MQLVEKLISSLEEVNKRSKGMFIDGWMTSAPGVQISDAGGEVTIHRDELPDDRRVITIPMLP